MKIPVVFEFFGKEVNVQMFRILKCFIRGGKVTKFQQRIMREQGIIPLLYSTILTELINPLASYSFTGFLGSVIHFPSTTNL